MDMIDTKELPFTQSIGLLDRVGGKTKHVGTAFACFQAYQGIQTWRETYKLRKAFTISVSGADSVYSLLHQWALKSIPDHEQRSLMLDTHRKAPFARLRYDGARPQSVQVDGHAVSLMVTQGGNSGDDGEAMVSDHVRRQNEKIVFSCDTAEARDAVVKMIDGLAESRVREDERPPLLLPSRWGGDWTNRDDLKPRTLDSVILKSGQLERLVDDLSTFLESEDTYARLFQPWHRGYLFHGNPGTGKTSIARAIAHHFSMPVYYLPLGDLKEDASLIGLVQQIKSQCMLLIEDVDVYHAATDRDDDGEKTSLSAVLNSLDGIWTPHGLVTVLTTNDRDKLDPALVRAGRVDLDEEFTVLDEDQAQRLAAYAGSSLDVTPYIGRSPAEYLEVVRREQARSRR